MSKEQEAKKKAEQEAKLAHIQKMKAEQEAKKKAEQEANNGGTEDEGTDDPGKVDFETPPNQGTVSITVEQIAEITAKAAEAAVQAVLKSGAGNVLQGKNPVEVRSAVKVTKKVSTKATKGKGEV